MGRRLVDVREMAVKLKQSFFIPTLPFKVQQKSLSTNLKLRTSKDETVCYKDSRVLSCFVFELSLVSNVNFVAQ